MTKVRIIPKAPGPGHKGKRARRSAFGCAARSARRLQQAVNTLNQIDDKGRSALEKAYLDAIVHGVGWVTMP